MKKIGILLTVLIVSGVQALAQITAFESAIPRLALGMSKLSYVEQATIYVGPDESRLLGECVFRLPDEQRRHRLQADRGPLRQPVYVALSFAGADDVQPLYPSHEYTKDGKDAEVTVRFLLPSSLSAKLKDRDKWEDVAVRLRIDNRLLHRGRGNFPLRGQRSGASEEVTFEIKRDADKFAEAKEAWLVSLKRQLTASIRLHQDNEAEILALWRWSGNIPTDRHESWKDSPIFEYAASLSGMRDVQDALPDSPDKTIEQSARTETPPEPITLPLVETGTTELPQSVSPLAKWCPRSCYYVEFENAGDFLAVTDEATELFDEWSPGTYPIPATELLDEHLDNLGIDRDFLNEHRDSIRTVAVAGWDPYYQSGTNVLLLLETDGEIPLPDATPFTHRAEGALLLSTGEKMIAMAKNAFAEGKSLRQVNNFRDSRHRVAPKDGEDGKVFLYLSDFWFTNLLSPRWWIHTKRRNLTDARIRLVHLLNAALQRETGHRNPYTVKEMRTNKSLPESMRSWLFKGLETLETNPSDVVHEEIGGLYAHTPIDELPFVKVTKEEKKAYENFRRDYVRRWQQMDPVAFQLVRDETSGKWKYRLYVSPISLRSDYRNLTQLVPKEKSPHRWNLIDGQVAGLSVKIHTPMIQPFLHGIKLPVTVTLQALGFDMASRSVTPQYWWERRRGQLWHSHARAPVAIAAPSLLLRALRPMVGGELVESGYEDIDEIPRFSYLELYSLLHHDAPDIGIGYFGLDPDTMIRIRDDDDKEGVESDVVSDIAFFLDLHRGHKLRIKLLIEAVKNRSIAGWRRNSRIRRAANLLGLNEKQMNTIFDGKIFPGTYPKFTELISAMPREYGLDMDKRRRYSNVTNFGFDELPDALTNLKRTDGFITIEPSALLFEGHFSFFEDEINSGRTSPRETSREEPDEEEEPRETTLDFDAG